MQDRNITFHERRVSSLIYPNMSNALTKHIESKWVKATWIIWSWFVPVAILFAIAFKLINDPENLSLLDQLKVSNSLGLIICLLLLPLNVGLESWKWQFILRPVEYKSFIKCLKVVLIGKSLNVVSPFGIGDAFSRFVGISSMHRKQTIAALAIDRISQMLPTLVFGLVSVFYLLIQGFSLPLNWIVYAMIALGVVLISGALVFRLFKEKISEYLLLIHELSWALIIKISSLSLLRYLVFLSQFYFVFWALGSELDGLIVLLGVAWIFLFKTLLPNMSVLGDLAKREVSAVLFFSFFISDLSVVLVASFIVWLINIVFPALLGVFFLSDLKRSF